jgi:large subunit ribosomal protein L25
MKEITLNAKIRKESGKKQCRDLRRQGLVPSVVYGVEKDGNGLPLSKSIVVTEKELAKLLYTPNVYIVNLNIEGDLIKVILKELQCDPVSDRPIHIDFYQITDAPIVIEIPVKLNGLAEGVKAGGKLVQNMRKLKVKAPYTSLPDTLNIDVSGLTLGKSLKVGALDFDGLEIVTSKEVVVCAVRMTRAARSAADQTQESTEE